MNNELITNLGPLPDGVEFSDNPEGEIRKGTEKNIGIKANNFLHIENIKIKYLRS
jgi:hypothetical protein